mmetsp:Transcript_1874/g.4949  ORF Transcript_1874/g.4949 Transcript_1874/m.4949 type:complete len:319 (-) Transcript_1874:569-1525(-)
MSLLLDACLNYAFSPQQIAVGLAGLIKLGDILSDVFFILDLKEWHNLFGRSWLFDGEEKINYKRYLIAAAVFTAVGIAYDLCMCYVVIKERQKNNTVTEKIKKGFRAFAGMFFDAEDGGKDEEYVWWKHIHLVIEEIPQLTILLCFFADYYRGCEYCSDDQKQYMTSLFISAVVSTFFTCLTIIRISVGMYRAWVRNKARKNGMLSSLPTVAVFGEEKPEEGKVERKMRQLKETVRPPGRASVSGNDNKKDSISQASMKVAASEKALPGIRNITPTAAIKKMRQLKEAVRPPGRASSSGCDNKKRFNLTTSKHKGSST